VPRDEVDEIFLDESYYIVPTDKVGTEAFAVIREAMRKEDLVGLARVVLYRRERILMLQPRDEGLMATALRYRAEVRKEKNYFSDISDVKVPADMLDLAVHILKSKKTHFDPDEFKDRYVAALTDLIKAKQAGKPVPKGPEPPPSNVINLMDALKRSLANEKQAAPASAKANGKEAAKAQGKKPRKAASGQREMLLPISGSGKRAAKETVKEAPKKAAKPVRAPARSRKAG
jgi:DNA end-binding protein Ku